MYSARRGGHQIAWALVRRPPGSQRSLGRSHGFRTAGGACPAGGSSPRREHAAPGGSWSRREHRARADHGRGGGMGRGRIMRRNRNGKQKSGFRPNGNAALTGRPRSMLMGHKESDVTSGRGDRSRARRVPVRARVGAWAGNRPVFDKLRRQPRRVHERQLHRAFRHRSLALQARSPRDSSRALPVVGTPRAASTSLSLARSTGMVRPGRRRPRRRDLRARRGSASKPHGLPRGLAGCFEQSRGVAARS